MKTAMICVATILSTGVMAMAQDAAPAAPKTDAFALDFSAEAEYYGFGEKLFVVTPTVDFDLFEVLDASVSLPVYNDSVETGLGDLMFAANYGLFQSKTGLLGANSSTLSVGAEVGLPLDGRFASDSLTVAANASFGLNWDKVEFEQTGSYLFDTDGKTFVPVFGGFVDGSVVTAESTVSYAFNNNLKVGVQFAQNYNEGSKFLSLGPTVDWNVSNTVDLDLSAGFPVQQEDMPNGECDFTISAGLGFRF